VLTGSACVAHDLIRCIVSDWGPHTVLNHRLAGGCGYAWRVCAASGTIYRHFEHLDPAGGGGERTFQLWRVDAPVGDVIGAAQRTDIGSGRGAEDALEPIGICRRPLLEARKYRAAVVGGDHDCQIRSRFAGPDE